MVRSGTSTAAELAPLGTAEDDRPAYLESVVSRVCEDSGAQEDDVSRYAVEVAREYANARLQSYIPVLVEKRLRDRWRRRPDLETA